MYSIQPFAPSYTENPERKEAKKKKKKKKNNNNKRQGPVLSGYHYPVLTGEGGMDTWITKTNYYQGTFASKLGNTRNSAEEM